MTFLTLNIHIKKRSFYSHAPIGICIIFAAMLQLKIFFCLKSYSQRERYLYVQSPTQKYIMVLQLFVENQMFKTKLKLYELLTFLK